MGHSSAKFHVSSSVDPRTNQVLFVDQVLVGVVSILRLVPIHHETLPAVSSKSTGHLWKILCFCHCKFKGGILVFAIIIVCCIGHSVSCTGDRINL